MILVYVTNRRLDEVADLPFDGRVGYRNPDYWRGEVEKCDKVYIHGNYPELRQAYGDKVVNFDSKPSKSQNKYPIKKGAGWYELSNGETVRGKDKAIQAQKELD